MDYTKHEMEMVLFENRDVFAFIDPTNSETGTYDYEEPQYDM